MASSAQVKIKVPYFDSVKKTYARYVQEVEYWKIVCKVDKKEQAVLLAYGLPEEDPSGIRDKFFHEVKIADLHSDDGMTHFMTYMDKLFKKDDQTQAYEDYVKFDSYRRANDQLMQSFILEFDKLYNIAAKRDMKLPPTVLAFKLLDAAVLSKQDRMFVLTGIDYSKKQEIYEQTKTALRKFVGEQGMNVKSSSCDIKVEPVFTATQLKEADAETEEILASAGFYRRNEKFQRRTKYKPGQGKQHQQKQGNSSQQQHQQESKSKLEKPMNPKDHLGYLMKCSSCGSFRHMLPDCQHSYENMAKKEEEGIILFTGYGEMREEQMAILTNEAGYKGILDSGCTSTVTGSQWMEDFLDNLSLEERSTVIEEPSKKWFKFGSGEPIQSRKLVEFPCTLAGVKIRLRTDVVDCSIPLLISKKTMKKAGGVLDLANDRARFFDRWISCDCTSSGHYLVSLGKDEVCLEEVMTVLSLGISGEKVLLKLHRQFGHPPFSRFVDFLKDAGKWEECHRTTVEDIYRTCGTCKKFAKTPPRPVCSLPVAAEFGEVLTMDLKEYSIADKRYILHMIDAFTRYSRSSFMRRKLPKLVIENVMTNWISIFGTPKRIWSDLGGEFTAAEMKEMSETFGITLGTGAGMAPWMNGVCERNHQITDICLEKILHDNPRMNPEIALAWASNAKNSLKMNNGFSSHQLVFGKNPSLPAAHTDKLPALDGTTTSETVAEHIKALYQARREFIKSESNERIRRALRHKVRATERHYEVGQMVYYKRDGQNKWHGPAKVIGLDGSMVCIKHQSSILRVATCRLQPTEQACCEEPRQQENEEAVGNKREMASDVNSMSEELQTNVRDDSNVAEELQTSVVYGNNSIRTSDVSSVSEQLQTNVIDNTTNSREMASDVNNISEELQTNVIDNMTNTREMSGVLQTDESSKKEMVLPKRGDLLKYKDTENAEWKQALVISRAGKQSTATKGYTGNKWCVNIQDSEDNSTSCLNLKNVADWRNISREGTIEEINLVLLPRKQHNTAECQAAKEKELKNFKEFNVYEKAKDIGQERISCTWILSEKVVEGDKIVKARLVARGFEETADVRSDSPTCSKDAFRIFLSIAVAFRWTINSTDIKSAFLQGQPLKRSVYVEPPKEAGEPRGVLWRLKKCMYGLNDAPRSWFLNVVSVLKELGCCQLKLDSSVFVYKENNSVIGLILLHVDDFMHIGDDMFYVNVMQKLNDTFTVGAVGKTVFSYIGLDLQQSGERINLSQESYISKLEIEPWEDLTRKQNKTECLTDTEKHRYRGAVGKLNWIARQTRPDVIFEVMELSTRFNNATVQELLRAEKALKKVKITSAKISYPDLGPCAGWYLMVMSDAAYANLSDKVSSSGGYVVLIVGKDKNCAPITWKANKIQRVVRSTLAAEALQFEEALEHAIYIQHLLKEMIVSDCELPIEAWTDCNDLYSAIYSSTQVSDKRLRIDLACIKENITKEKVLVKWCPGNEMLADCLTKRGADTQKLLNIFEAGSIKYHFKEGRGSGDGLWKEKTGF